MQPGFLILEHMFKNLYYEYWEKPEEISILRHLSNFNAPDLDDLAKELLAEKIIDDSEKKDISDFTTNFPFKEILTNSIIMTGIISISDPFVLKIPFLSNLPAIGYMWFKGIYDLARGKKFMASYNLNPIYLIFTLPTGSIGYLQQSYVLAPNISVMKFISYSSVCYLMDLLRYASQNDKLSKFTELIGLLTKTVGIEKVEDFNRISFARQIYHINGDSLSSLMKHAEKLYSPYLFLGDKIRKLNNYVSKKFNSKN